jgi:hypothetical protein
MALALQLATVSGYCSKLQLEAATLLELRTMGQTAFD